MSNLSIDVVEVENKIKKIIMYNESIKTNIKNIDSNLKALEKCYISSNSDNIEADDINLKKKLQEILDERQVTIKEIKRKLETYQKTEMEVRKIFDKRGA